MSDNFRMKEHPKTGKRAGKPNDVDPLTTYGVKRLIEEINKNKKFDNIKVIKSCYKAEDITELKNGFTVLNEIDRSLDYYHFLLCYRFLNNLYFFDPSGRGIKSIEKRREKNGARLEYEKWDISFIDAIKNTGLNIHVADNRLQRDYGSCGDFVVEMYVILQEKLKNGLALKEFNEYLKSYFPVAVTNKQLEEKET